MTTTNELRNPTPAVTPAPFPGPAGWPRVVVIEEGMREGLQIESATIPVEDKVRLLNAISETGLTRIVVGSFVSPKWTPQMALVDELVSRFTPREGVTYTALALNRRGVERQRTHTPPLTPPLDPPSTYAHLCDVFAQRNTNRTQQQEIAAWSTIIDDAVESGAQSASIGVGAAWGSNWLGSFSHDQRMDLLAQQHNEWARAGVRIERVFLADPMGWNQPHLVAQDVSAITRRWPEITTVHLHLHNTRGIAAASIYAALRELKAEHVLAVDSSIGGMAGCPYCGNGRAATLMATEDLVHMLEGIGYNTGVDLDKLVRVVRLAEKIVGHPLYGHVSKAGPRPGPTQLYAMDMPFIETLDQASHFLYGESVYEDAASPWREPITSNARQESNQ